MSSGSDIESGRNTTGESTTVLIADTTNDDPPVDFNGNTILVVGPRADAQTPFHTIDGIVGLGWNGAVESGSQGGTGIIGAGGPNQGTGVAGLGGATGFGNGGTGVDGRGGQGTAFGFAVVNPGIGVFGEGGGVDPLSPPPVPGAPGVMGIAGATADGVVGTSSASGKSGVFGFNGQNSDAAFGVFGRCDSSVGAGAGAFSQNGYGVLGVSGGTPGFGRAGVAGAIEDAQLPGIARAGVVGACRTSFTYGVWGLIDNTNPSDDAIAVFGTAGITINPDGSIGYIGQAGNFSGPVGIEGDLTVFGAKSAAVRHHDGSYRKLYSVESPDSWFEDFGEAALIDGKTRVDLDPDFAALVDRARYHVFLTPYEDCNGLYVSGRSSRGFDVVETRNGASNVRFSYRIVARRKDIVGERLARVAAPISTRQPQLLQVDKAAMTADQLAQLSSGAAIPRPPRPAIPKTPQLKSR
jgi:hypothetical protein